MDDTCTLDEALLLDYITGDAPAELRKEIERSPACLAATQELAREVRPLLRLLYRRQCPEPATLVAYQQQQLGSAEQLVLHKHVQGCPLCQEDLELAAAIAAVPLEPGPGFLWRVVEAVLQPPLALQFREGLQSASTIRHYQTPQITINLSMRKTRSRPITWTLRGELRTPDGLPAAGVLEGVTLRQFDHLNEGERQGTVEENGTFVVRDLASGTYSSLHLLLAEEEVIIRRLVIGADE